MGQYITVLIKLNKCKTFCQVFGYFQDYELWLTIKYSDLMARAVWASALALFSSPLTPNLKTSNLSNVCKVISELT